MKITVIGSGYVGLVTGVCLAAKGHEVVCIDKKKETVEAINNMITPIYEPGLETLLRQVVSLGRLSATVDLTDPVLNSEISIVAVGTPFGDGRIDLSFIEDAVREIGEVIREKNDYHVVCIKSTVVPTTTDTVVKDILEHASGKRTGEFGLAMNPEFLREGKAVEDFMNPDRIVIGAFDDKTYGIMKEIYAGFDTPIIKVNLRTAEMIKYTANALLATLISYSNEVASICEATGGIDVKEVLKAVTLDKRLNPRVDGQLINPEMIKYLEAGCGFGGSCFPKDVKALISYSSKKGYMPRIIESTVSVNQEQPLRAVKRLELALGGLADKKIALLGLAFKPETDDVRESPSIKIIRELISKSARVYGVDPIAVESMDRVIPQVESRLVYTTEYQLALKDADAVMIVTSWAEFTQIPPKEFTKLMRNPLIVDCRRIFDKSRIEETGAVYIGTGLVE